MKFDINKEKDFLLKCVIPSFMLLVPWKVKGPGTELQAHNSWGSTLQFADVEYKVKISQASSNNPVKAVVSKVGFVTQDDVLFPQLTVKEAFVFAVFLRLPSKMSRRQKYERAEVIIKELGLERCRHTRIGRGLIKGISGGERKKTSIAYEILVDSSLLLLDEPTSGLDSSSARKERVGSPFRLSVA
ncbi:ABC transporter G family member 22 [Capsicum baccatum]|uniref:ABC transporter G family member 22 n=1 Tax=Capsicum baccatum TaxID=33114 RepID=A0A2G2VMG5_CAPBA|nr:ABC transporter G family member 22 [Capsicum baccatum]